MRIARTLLGKYVVVTWKDPAGDRVQSHLPDGGDLRKGRAALATWEECGVIDDLTDGVVRLRQSQGMDPGCTTSNEFYYSWIPEDLVEAILVLTPEASNV